MKENCCGRALLKSSVEHLLFLSVKFYKFFNIWRTELQKNFNGVGGSNKMGGLQQIYSGVVSKCVEEFLKWDDNSKETMLV